MPLELRPGEAFRVRVFATGDDACPLRIESTALDHGMTAAGADHLAEYLEQVVIALRAVADHARAGTLPRPESTTPPELLS